MARPLRTYTFVKPAAYEKLGEKGTKDYLCAQQDVIQRLRRRIVYPGRNQLYAKTGFSKEKLPQQSPVHTNPTLDGLVFDITTSVRLNTHYQAALDEIAHFLEIMHIEFSHQRNGPTIRRSATEPYEPMIRWDHLMEYVFRHYGRSTERGIENRFDVDYEVPKADQLAVLQVLYRKFDINRPGAAKLWLAAREFCGRTEEDTVTPLKEDMETLLGEKKEHFEPVGPYVVGGRAIDSPFRRADKVYRTVFHTPTLRDENGIPVILTDENYITLLPNMRQQVDKILGGKHKLEGGIGELVVLYFGLESHPRVQSELSFLPQYRAERDGQVSERGDNLWVSLAAAYSRIKSLEKELVQDRTLYVVRVWPSAHAEQAVASSVANQ